MPLTPALYLPLLVALLQTALGLASPWLSQATRPSTDAIPDIVFIATVLTLAGCSALLFIGGRRDRRAMWLAASYLLSASAFSSRLLATATDAGTTGRILAGVKAIEVNALLPYFVWGFAFDFPRVTRFGMARGIQHTAAWTSLVVGTLLIVVNVLSFASGGTAIVWTGETLVGWLSRANPRSAYWPLVLGLLFVAFLSILWKARIASADEQRRVRWLVVGAAFGLAPVLVVTGLDSVSHAFQAFIDQPHGMRLVGAVAYPFVIAGPAIVAYSVLVHRALEVRIVVRKAVQYALATRSLALLSAIPFLLILGILIRNRNRTLVDMLSGTGAIALLTAAALGFAGLFLRRRLTRGIDRLFFREQYDARRILGDLAERSRDATRRGDLAALLIDEIGRALHPDSCTLFVVDTQRQQARAVGRGVRPLSLDSTLVKRLARTGRPFEVEWSKPDSAASWLPAKDADWLNDGRYCLLLPLMSSGNDLLGLLALGEKRSELPYSSEDHTLLTAIAASAALVIENRLLLSQTPTTATSGRLWGTEATEPVFECERCGSLDDSDDACERCGGRRVEAHVPAVVGGRYRLCERIGRGGMGVVYRAEDGDLGRSVAIKTLPDVSPRLTQRLRREARAMASVSHPNLATIYSVESWLGTPMLVVEYLPGGTLADRLKAGPLQLEMGLRLGSVLAGVVSHLHDVGILHRDIKPSNIAFTELGLPKLLDFGIARMIEASLETGVDAFWPDDPEDLRTTTGQVVGTLAYMSPEALDGREPSPAFDLWSLCVVLYEALSGVRPFRGAKPYVAVAKIIDGNTPCLRDDLPTAPPGLVSFFQSALASDPRARPPTALELRRRIDELYATLAGAGIT